MLCAFGAKYFSAKLLRFVLFPRKSFAALVFALQNTYPRRI
jgi:hypothetical protein